MKTLAVEDRLGGVNRFKRSWSVGIIAIFGFGVMGLLGASLTLLVSGIVAWTVSALHIHAFDDTEHLGWIVFAAAAMPYFVGETVRMLNDVFRQIP